MALITCAFFLLIMIGAGSYYFGVVSATYKPNAKQLRYAYVQTSLEKGQTQLWQAQRNVEQQLDTFGRRLGQVQAHMSRLNALGKRLTDMAGLETNEFSFNSNPAIGGPVHAGEDQTATDLIVALEQLERSVLDKKDELEILESLLVDYELHSKQFPHGWPVEGGWISSGYGYRNDPFSGKRTFHGGVDIASKPRAPIRAVAAGVVTVAGEKAGYGLVVEVNHGKGYVTRYAHAQTTMVGAGDRVEKGDVVATVGSTGRSTGTHLHFEVLHNGKAVNPLKYIRASL